MSHQEGAFQEWGMPLGQMVESEAFTLEQSLSFTDSLEKIAVLTHQLQTLRSILTDRTRPESQRLRDALQAMQQETSQSSLSRIEEGKREVLVDLVECQEVIVGEPTINIELASQDDLRSSGEKEITAAQNLHSEQHRRLHSGDGCKEEVRTQKEEREREREQAEAEHRRQIAQLSRKLQQNQERLARCSCGGEKGQEIAKLTKWLETLNKLLFSAQKQAAAYKDDLRRTNDLAARQLREKDEQLRLRDELLTAKDEQLRQQQEQIKRLSHPASSE